MRPAPSIRLIGFKWGSDYNETDLVTDFGIVQRFADNVEGGDVGLGIYMHHMNIWNVVDSVACDLWYLTALLSW
jgi:hypothetical protein